MSEYNYDAEDAFEEYLCFSAVLSQKLKSASDAIEELAYLDEPDPEYVRGVVQSVMKPLMDLMEHKINKYPWSVENVGAILMICQEKGAARKFVKDQIGLYEEYYELLPVIAAKDEVDKKLGVVIAGFDAVLKELE